MSTDLSLETTAEERSSWLHVRLLHDFDHLTARIAKLEAERDKWRDEFMSTYEQQEWLQAMRDSLKIHLADARTRIAELEHMNRLMRDHAGEMLARIAELEAKLASYDAGVSDREKLVWDELNARIETPAEEPEE